MALTSPAGTMSAILKDRPDVGFTYSSGVSVPVPGPGDVIIAVTHAGICGTDRHIYQWDSWSQNRVKIGITIGHEFVGRVVAIGDSVQDTHVGQRVSAEGHIVCGKCYFCRTGQAHICQNLEVLGIDRDGCFAQYVVVPEENLWQVDPRIPDPIAAIFDPLGNAMHTVMTAGVSEKSVLITGVGTIGLMAVAMAKDAGASKILVSDLHPDRLDHALRLGADYAFLSDDPTWQQQARQVTENLGPEVLLEISGNEQAIHQGLQTLRSGGTAALLGVPAKPITLNLPDEVIFKGITLHGITGRRMFETWYQVQDFLLRDYTRIESIITHQMELKEYQRGIELMQTGQAIKVVLHVPQEQLPQNNTAAQSLHDSLSQSSSPTQV